MPLDTEKMEQIRQEKGWTQEEAAAKAGLSGKSYWRDIISGRRSNVSVEVLEKIAKGLGINAKELLK